ETGRMLLSDFGLARTAASETLTQTGQAIGTPLYMSPEQVSTQSEVDGRSDVYGLGVTLYEALSGRPPFEPTDMAALINLKLTVPAPDLRKYAPDVPADLARIAMTAVEKEKADRYESAEAMASDLRAWIGGRKVAGRPVSSARRRWRRSRRNILLAASMVLAAIGIWQLIPPADGAVTVTANVQAQVTVDGVSEGTTEVHVVRSPGSYVFALTRSGCDAVRFEHLVRSGAEDRHHVQMQVKDGDSENNLDDFGESLGITFEDGPLQRPRSGGSGLGLQILYPRGSVRVSDLTEVMLEFNDPLVETSGEIQLRRLGSEVPLWTGTLSDDDEAGFIQPIEFPPSLRAAVWPGDELTLGYYLPGWETTVHIVVTGDPCAESFPRVDGELAKQPELFRDHMKAQLLFDEALYTAAYFMARSITDRVPKSSRGWYLQKKCLERMGVLSGLRSEDLLDAFDGTDPEKQKLVDPTTGN
ncbi:MAG: serine/threonine-protein kinase, partial [Planctomycetota bacterium]